MFGPVVPIMEFSGFDEAIALANDSKYGLAAYLFTKDMDRVLTAVRGYGMRRTVREPRTRRVYSWLPHGVEAERPRRR